ncbi:MAG: polysaccharide deacetylase family protein [Phycisphaerales bacterium]|nr:polysaccharide deacetylase family protein [Phycisphaerales bacterium]
MAGFVVGIAALASLGIGTYAALAPRSQLFGPTFIGKRPGSKQLALTFDDGPNDPHTLHLLDVLAHHDVKATFFLIGRYVAQRPDIARAIVAAGHEVANHTFTHPSLLFLPWSRVRQELTDCEKALSDAVGAHAPLFRPPWGARRPHVLQTAWDLKLETVMWSVTCYDWKPTTPERIEQHAVRQIRGGDVILLHDGGHKAMGADRSATVAATDRLISRYKAEGREFVTVSRMMGRQIESLSD